MELPKNLFEVRLAAGQETTALLSEVWDEEKGYFSLENPTDDPNSYFRIFADTEEEAKTAAKNLEGLLKNLAISGQYSLEIRPLPKEDWAEKWKENFHVNHVGQRLVIVPSWEKYEKKPDEVVLTNDPGMAFGTGSHGTSQACLELLEEVVMEKKPASLLDTGTGTGILAIAAAKLGVGEIDAFDNEPQAILASSENQKINGLDSIRFFEQDLFQYEASRQYGLVIANILCIILEQNVQRLAKAVAPNGHLILAGILDEQYSALAALFIKAGFMEVKSRLIAGWRSGLFTRPAGLIDSNELYAIESVTENPDRKEEIAAWFQGCFGIPKEAYIESMAEAISNGEAKPVPGWFVIRHPKTNEIMGGAGIIENDFHERKDLAPNLCALFVMPQFRNRGLAGRLLSYISHHMKAKGTGTLYLVTEHESFYERYGWRFQELVKETGSDHLTRLYCHKQ